jgi:hypothetical protein
MVAKRGELKPADAWEENIRQNPLYYRVVGFSPGKGKTYQTFDNLVWAKAYAAELMREAEFYRLRTAMVYAVGEYEHATLVGSYGINKEWKPVIPKRW